jgi:two-component system response regulator RegX3
VLRVKAVLRRTRPDRPDARILLDADLDIAIDPRALEIQRGAQRLPLTRREADILVCLAQHAERPVTRAELLHEVWGYARDLDLDTRTVDIHIAKLRRKLETDAACPRWLVTVRGAGYRLMVYAHAARRGA